jgi:hypothetical protein
MVGVDLRSGRKEEEVDKYVTDGVETSEEARKQTG